MTLDEALREYAEIGEEFVESLRAQGIAFAEPGADEGEIAAAMERLRDAGVAIRNGGASVCSGDISTACVACTGCPTSATYYFSLKCSRKCYFCFNPNQMDYELHLRENRDWRAEFDAVSAAGTAMTHVALTGGEPLLDPAETLAFFSEAHRRWPDAHLRLYTTGDFLDEALLEQLVDVGLSEIRFSIKLDDPDDEIDGTLDTIRMACGHDLDVMVEMPVIPGTEERMRELLVQLDEAGAFGINLLEFCFPLHNWEAFAERGFKVRNPPFPVLYDYGYAGGLPIAGSELACLRLVEFAAEQGLRLGVHYCSLENKHRDQVLTQNRLGSPGPVYAMDQEDFFWKAGKAFGLDAQIARGMLQQVGLDAWDFDPADESLAFSLDYADRLAGAGVPYAVSYNVLEPRGGQIVLRELDLKRA